MVLKTFKIIKLAITIIGWFLATNSNGQSSTNLNVDHFQFIDGLINNHVLCTYQDKRGIVWAGTYSGLQTFDGYNFKSFNSNNLGKNLFTNHVVLSIAEDKADNLWFGTEYGLNKYNIKTEKITKIIIKKGNSIDLVNNQIRDISIDSKGVLWLGTYGGGLIAYDDAKQKFTQYKSSKNNSTGLQSNFINSLFTDNQGLLWIATENGGISVFNRDKKLFVKKFAKKKAGITDGIINCIFQDYYGNYWFGTWNGGLIKYNPQNETFKNYNSFSHKQTQKKSCVRWIEQTDKDFLWVGTYGSGLYKFDIHQETSTKIELIKTDNKNTKEDYIWKLNKDYKGNLWISTFGSGIFVINPTRNTFPAYSIRDPENNTRLSIACFLEDEQNRLWIGTYNSGIYIYNFKTKSVTKFIDNPRINGRINYLYLDRKKNIWVATEKELLMLLPDRKESKIYEHIPENTHSLSKGSINTVIEDKNGNIWIGLWGKGINILSKEDLLLENTKNVDFKKYDSIQTNPTIANKNILKLFNDSRGNIWMATPDKLAYYNPDKNKFNSLNIYSISSFHETETGDIWVSSMGTSLNLIDKNYQIVKSYNLNNGLDALHTGGILKDTRGRLWFGTNNGIIVSNPNDETFYNYDKNFGLEFNEVNMHAYLLLKSGDMAFGGNEGFTIFSPEKLGSELYDGQTYITDIKILNKSYGTTSDTNKIRNTISNKIDTLNLKFNENVISISFSAIDFFNPHRIKYAYRLEGLDKDWNITDSKNRIASYTNLKPGKYTFTVKASYNQKNWGLKQAKIHININKPVWLRLWFKLTIAILIFSLFSIVFHFLFKLKFNHQKKELIRENEILMSNKQQKNQEILQLQNEKLNTSLSKCNKKIAALAFNNHNSMDKISMVCDKLKEIEQRDECVIKKLLKKIINELDKHLNENNPDGSKLGPTAQLLFEDYQKRLSEEHPKLTHKDLQICTDRKSVV